MDRNQPVQVMIWDIKDVQPFLLSHPEDNMSLPDTALVNYTMNKISKTGIYSKALARWNAKTATDRTIWGNFRHYMIAAAPDIHLTTGETIHKYENIQALSRIKRHMEHRIW